jgi:predicted transcriptional regulator
MPGMNSDRKLEQRMEAAVISELRRQPLYALELITALGGNKNAVVGAVERLDAGGLICSPKSGARFELV